MATRQRRRTPDAYSACKFYKPPGRCPRCGKYTKEWWHVGGTGHTSGDFSKDIFWCRKCYKNS